MAANKNLWAGFVGGKVALTWVDTGFGGYGAEKTLVPAIFTRRKDARREYEDVRRIEVRELP